MNLDLIRPACLADTERVTHLVNRAYRPGSGAAGWTHESRIITGDRIDIGQVSSKIQQAGSFVLVGMAGNELVACIHIEMHLKTSHFGMLAVDPDYQSRGTGKQMLAFAEEYTALHISVERFTISVISSRIELVEFYQRRGYRKTGLPSLYPLTLGIGNPIQHDLTVETLEKPNIRTAHQLQL